MAQQNRIQYLYYSYITKKITTNKLNCNKTQKCRIVQTNFMS